MELSKSDQVVLACIILIIGLAYPLGMSPHKSTNDEDDPQSTTNMVQAVAAVVLGIAVIMKGVYYLYMYRKGKL